MKYIQQIYFTADIIYLIDKVNIIYKIHLIVRRFNLFHKYSIPT